MGSGSAVADDVTSTNPEEGKRLWPPLAEGTTGTPEKAAFLQARYATVEADSRRSVPDDGDALAAHVGDARARSAIGRRHVTGPKASW